MQEKLVILERFTNPIEAEYWCSVLNEAEVAAFVDGAATNTALSHVGSALGGVKVLVGETDQKLAMKILSEQREKKSHFADWRCGNCQEQNDGSFEICWNCEQEKSEYVTEIKEEKTKDQLPEQSDAILESMERKIQLAYRSSILGLCFLPFIMHGYSFVQLFEVSSSKTILNMDQEKLWYRALFMNFIGVMLWMFLAAVLFRNWR